MFHLARILQAHVNFGAWTSRARFDRSCSCPKESNSTCAAPASDSNPVRRRTAAAFMGIVALASLSARASAQDHSSRNLPADQSAQVAQICKTVIRVQPEEAHYDACMDSLSASLKDVVQARTMQRARDNCIDSGLAPASPQLAECLLSNDPRSGSTAAVSSRSYFYASADEARHREQLSCARLGFEPASGAFTSCVAGLAATLSASDMPLN